MDAEVKDLIAILGTIKNEAKEAIQELPADALNWNPIPGEANSIYAIVAHMCGTEGFWIHRLIGREKVSRDRDAEFAARGDRVEDLVAMLDQTQEVTRRVLGKEFTQSLNRTVSPGPNRPSVTARDGVLHTIEHIATHLGHLHLTKQWWQRQQS